MLTVNRITKSYNLSPVLNDITFSIAAGQRVGLIGHNGSGKSTLLRIIMGQETADGGQVMLTPSTLRLGYLAQGLEIDPTTPLAEVLAQVVDETPRLEARLAELAAQLVTQPDDVALHRAYDRTLTRLANGAGGNVTSIPASIGLGAIDPRLHVGRLSGGQKTRLALALVLLGEPDVLLLDEPTNHLDVEMLEWLETWLADFAGAALIVSHDRTFLDRTANRILDLNPIHHTIREYAGNYSDYLEQYLANRAASWRPGRITHTRCDALNRILPAPKNRLATSRSPPGPTSPACDASPKRWPAKLPRARKSSTDAWPRMSALPSRSGRGR